MTRIAPAAKKHSAPKGCLYLFLAVVIVVTLYVCESIFFMPLQSVDNVYGSSADKEFIWSGPNPSVHEVENYLAGKTFVISRPPLGNYAYFFSEDHRLFVWHDIIVENGTWSVFRIIVPMTYGNNFKLRFLSEFCKEFYTPPVSNQDNCIIVRNLNDMFYDDVSISNGDILGLRGVKRKSVRMPTDAISIDSLLRTEREFAK